MNELISVIMPVYNAEQYLATAIESILSQTYSKFELIIINDGSTDSSLNIIQHYANIDSRLIVITRENRGLVETLNEGIMRAKGAYIARMDADDYSFPKRFEKEMKLFAMRPEVYLVGTNFVNIYDENVLEETQKQKERFSKNVNEPVGESTWQEDIFEDYKILHPTWIVKKQLFDEIGLYREFMSEDGEFLFRTVWNGYAVGKVNEVLLKYRITEKAKSSVEGKTLENKKQIMQFKLDYLEEKKRFSKEEFRYMIWGADISGELFLDLFQRRYPKAKCVAYIDSFVEGEKDGIPIILPQLISECEQDYIFICTNGGRKVAISKMRELRKNVIKDYFKVV